MEANEILLSAAVFVGTALAAAVAYAVKPKQSSQNSIITGVGMELGSRAQIDLLIAALYAIRDAIEAKNQNAVDRQFKEILNKLDEKEGP